METQVTEEDVSKPVVYDGDTIGRIVSYEDETAYVEPDPGITDLVRSKLGWADPPEDAFPLQRELVREIRDDEIVLESEM